MHVLGDWHPRTDQEPLWRYLLTGGKRAVMVAHRRWGKDDVALRFAAWAMGNRVGNYWHMLPEYNQARKSIWLAINPHTGTRRTDETFHEAARAKTKDQEMMIEFTNGSTWQLVGSDTYNSLVGSSPVGIVFSEWALANPQAWVYLAPILEENDGWALFIYTPRGNNHGRTMLRTATSSEGWFGKLMAADRTPVFNLGQLAAIRTNLVSIYGEEQGEAFFKQEYFCSFDSAVYGAYYAKQLAAARKDGRIGNVPHVPNFEVYTAWDLGVDDSTSIWFFQVVGKEFRFIDYYENVGYGMAHYAKVLKEKPYVYGDHYMPHDADQRIQGESEIAKSKKEIAEQLGIKPVMVCPRPRNIEAVLLGIETGRNVLAQCWFDEKRCSHGLSALEGYRSEYDEEKKKLANRPLHDWCSHGADAFRTFAVGYRPQEIFKSVTDELNAVDLRGRW